MGFLDEPSQVTGVLLADGRWYDVQDGTFEVNIGDAYGGSFSFRERGQPLTISGTLHALQAVRTGRAETRVGVVR